MRKLAVWVERLRKLPLGEVDQELVAKAFTSSHSNAEVYRLERIESVLGPLKTIKPRTLFDPGRADALESGRIVA